MTLPALHRATLLVAALLVAASPAAAQRVQMPVGYRLTWIGARWNPQAKVVDGTGRQIAAPLTYRVADPSIASVTGRGDVVARKPGRTRLWAVSGKDSASALIVVEQWPAKFTFSPANVRLDALGAAQPIRVLASDSSGTPIVDGGSHVSACRSVNAAVARIAGDSVVAIANGSTWIRCSDRGMADSIRVDVQQRPVIVSITNKGALGRRMAGDTFSVRVQARDRLQKPVAQARPTWVSLNPEAVSVDPTSGRARAVNGGDARIIAQVGDVADSVSISVSGSTYQPVTVATTVDTTTKSKAQLIASEIYAFEAETTFVSITAFDSAGQPVPLSALTYRLLDTTVAQRLDTARIVGRKSGQTRMVVRYGNLSDTTNVSVATRSASRSVTGSGATGAGRGTFTPPTIADSTARYREIRRVVEDSIRLDPNTAAARQRFVINASPMGAIAEHLVRTDAGVIEDRTGALYGGGGSLLLFQRLELAGALRLGSLSSVDTVGEDLTLTEFEGSVGYFPVRNIGLRPGVVMRREATNTASKGWLIPKVSLVTRFSFIGDVVNTFAAISILPKAQFSGLENQTGSLFSRGGEAGLEFKRGALGAGITYFVEQISFDESDRVESFSAIRLRFGLNVGR
jgi:hypothetical protein